MTWTMANEEEAEALARVILFILFLALLPFVHRVIVCCVTQALPVLELFVNVTFTLILIYIFCFVFLELIRIIDDGLSRGSRHQRCSFESWKSKMLQDQLPRTCV